MEHYQTVEVRHGADLMKPMMADALCRVREDGKIVTDSLIIADQFERQHKNVLASLDGLIERGRIGQLDFKPTSYMDQWNRQQRMIELTERGALIAMPFIGGSKSEEGQVRLVDAFEATREELRRVKTEQPRPVALLPNFEDPAAAAEAWALQFRGRVVAEQETAKLRLTVTENAEAADFVKLYVDADGLQCLRSVSQSLDVENEREFMWFLENALRCCYRLEGGLVTRATHRHLKRFTFRNGINTDTNRAYKQTKVTAKGLKWLASEWAQYNLDRESYISAHAPKDGEVDEEADEAKRDEATAKEARRIAKEAAKKDGE